jgi:hypothetical protein
VTFQINRQGQPLGSCLPPAPLAENQVVLISMHVKYARLCGHQTTCHPFQIWQSDHLYYSRIPPSCSGSQAGSLQSVTDVIEGSHSLPPCIFQCIM